MSFKDYLKEMTASEFVKNDTKFAEIVAVYSDARDDIDDERTLDWKSKVPFSKDELIKAFKLAVPDGYNEFDVKQVEKLVTFYSPETQYFPAREGSVCIYAKGKKIKDFTAKDIKADELSEKNGEDRIWWD